MTIDREDDTRAEAHPQGPALEDFLDLEFEAFCARQGDERITLDEVRVATAGIPGSMAEAGSQDVRADRF